jgi:hypothetical protein
MMAAAPITLRLRVDDLAGVPDALARPLLLPEHLDARAEPDVDSGRRGRRRGGRSSRGWTWSRIGKRLSARVDRGDSGGEGAADESELVQRADVMLTNNAAARRSVDEVGAALNTDQATNRAARMIEAPFRTTHILDNGNCRAEHVGNRRSKVRSFSKESLVPRHAERADDLAIQQPLSIRASRQQPLRAKAGALQHGLRHACEQIMIPLGTANALVMLARRVLDNQSQLLLEALLQLGGVELRRTVEPDAHRQVAMGARIEHYCSQEGDPVVNGVRLAGSYVAERRALVHSRELVHGAIDGRGSMMLAEAVADESVARFVGASIGGGGGDGHMARLRDGAILARGNSFALRSAEALELGDARRQSSKLDEAIGVNIQPRRPEERAIISAHGRGGDSFVEGGPASRGARGCNLNVHKVETVLAMHRH